MDGFQIQQGKQDTQDKKIESGQSCKVCQILNGGKNEKGYSENLVLPPVRRPYGPEAGQGFLLLGVSYQPCLDSFSTLTKLLSKIISGSPVTITPSIF